MGTSKPGKGGQDREEEVPFKRGGVGPIHQGLKEAKGWPDRYPRTSSNRNDLCRSPEVGVCKLANKLPWLSRWRWASRQSCKELWLLQRLRRKATRWFSERCDMCLSSFSPVTCSQSTGNGEEQRIMQGLPRYHMRPSSTFGCTSKNQQHLLTACIWSERKQGRSMCSEAPRC